MWKVLHETRHVALHCWCFFCSLLLMENMTLITGYIFLTLQERSRSCCSSALTSLALSKVRSLCILNSPTCIGTLTPYCITRIRAIYLYNTEHKALPVNLRFFLRNSKHPVVPLFYVPLQSLKMRDTFYVSLPVNGLLLVGNSNCFFNISSVSPGKFKSSESQFILRTLCSQLSGSFLSLRTLD
ncbi:hypothetical protein HJG60_011898 [Phyllostomus discolor]|uniref:Uncharacterized protein n=1 Tax=Phyllostomus discolor TaxID=89673 RepID=A0A834DW12_9CHIR|nr:hypothetical protein HJG60_011898 [Phyllostomus discolor]